MPRPLSKMAVCATAIINISTLLISEPDQPSVERVIFSHCSISLPNVSSFCRTSLIALFRGYPGTIRTDQGPEFTCRTLDQWAFEHGVKLRLIQLGKPAQYGFIESINGRFRDKYLNEHVFSDIVHARKTVNNWRQDYNECRPHSALNYQTS